MSLNLSPPKFLYSAFRPFRLQKYRSGKPSPSMSPTATPDPLNNTRLASPVHWSSVFVKWIPVSSGESNRNPVLPPVSTFNSAHRKPLSSCHCSPAWLLPINSIVDRKNQSVRDIE